MGVLCDPIGVMALRDLRQKRYAKIQPNFDLKYGPYYSDGYLWHSYYDDAMNGMSMVSNVGYTSTNVSIDLPSTEVFHVQSPDSQTVYGSGNIVSYTYDNPRIEVPGETTLSCGVTMNIGGYFLDRDKPWLKVGISWECYGTVVMQERTFLGYLGQDNTPTWSQPEIKSTTPYYWFNQIEPDIFSGIGPHSGSNSLYVPPWSQPQPPPGEDLEVGAKWTQYYGWLSVANINIYRRGDYHHA